MRSQFHVTSSALVCAAVLCSSGASAQSLAGWTFPTQWNVGGIVLAVPKYEGSSKHRAIGIPIIAPVGGGESRVDIKATDDVRLRLATFQGFEIGPVAGYRFGREEDDARRLRGLGDVDGGFALGGYAAYRVGGLSTFVSYSHQLTGDETGGLIRFGVENRMPIQRWMTLTALVGATWADEDYMRSFFGVTAAQSSRSGLARYDAGAGIKDVHVGLSAEVPLDSSWTLRLVGRYAHLVGDAANSPIVEREGQLSGGVGLTYRFNFGK